MQIGLKTSRETKCDLSLPSVPSSFGSSLVSDRPMSSGARGMSSARTQHPKGALLPARCCRATLNRLPREAAEFLSVFKAPLDPALSRLWRSEMFWEAGPGDPGRCPSSCSRMLALEGSRLCFSSRSQDYMLI